MALSVSASGAGAQGFGPPPASTTLPKYVVWLEGALFSTGGGSFNVPALPLVGPPFYSFNHASGYEGAFGFDYRWTDPAWHFVFDIRYGRSRTKTASMIFGTPISGFSGTSISQASEHESHFVTDFMVGRDVGFGSELQFGIRIADLDAASQVTQVGFKTGFTSPREFASGNWHSRFVGAGPRLALTGSIPIVGWWMFDYGGGIAELIGTRSFDGAVTASFPGSYNINQSTLTAIFNADASLALSYLLTSDIKLSGGIRGDYYNSALTTYNVNTGALQNIDRSYWGPFIRLTGLF